MSFPSAERKEEEGVETYVGLLRRRLHHEGTAILVERTSENEYLIRMIVGKEEEDKKINKITNTGKVLYLSGRDQEPAEPGAQYPKTFNGRQINTFAGSNGWWWTLSYCTHAYETYAMCGHLAATKNKFRWRPRSLFGMRVRQSIDTTN